VRDSRQGDFVGEPKQMLGAMAGTDSDPGFPNASGLAKL